MRLTSHAESRIPQSTKEIKTQVIYIAAGCRNPTPRRLSSSLHDPMKVWLEFLNPR